MKKLLLVIICLLSISGTVFAAVDRETQRNAYNAMIQSQKYHNDVCQRAADNFRRDHRFTGYIRSTCLLFQSERQRLIEAVFPSANNVEDENYKDEYPILVSNFIQGVNNKEIEAYRAIINEYCRYHVFKFKNDPQVCAPARIESIFAR